MSTSNLSNLQTPFQITPEIVAAREKLVHIGALLFDRHLTDAAGGNISILVGDVVCFSPSYAGHQRQWQLQPENILVIDHQGNILYGQGSLSREARVHLRLYRDFGHVGTAVIHAHPLNMMVFAAMARPMPPVLEANLKFGTVPVIDYAPAHGPLLAERVAEALKGKDEIIKKQAAGVIAPWHGVFLIGKNMDATFDAVERFDTNAYCLLMARSYGTDLERERLDLEKAVARYKE
jgi:ribulose-5-phosphate 4-epimerase/fuculose-1-phosphate aldolase